MSDHHYLAVRVTPTITGVQPRVGVYDGATLLGYLATISIRTVQTRTDRTLVIELPADTLYGASSLAPDGLA